ncbi:hypothetical protein CMV30_02640 [Nibricoccus aquaticus]|uniref:Uncharacterized protein n=1 Tax=Nibricoccus aquaticus TaxID=2576891 RepID=A0A290Q3S0_9BACT|nr:hypothetical protein CMV30_02640 [Nibricoccus aquaticus]
MWAIQRDAPQSDGGGECAHAGRERCAGGEGGDFCGDRGLAGRFTRGMGMRGTNFRIRCEPEEGGRAEAVRGGDGEELGEKTVTSERAFA